MTTQTLSRPRKPRSRTRRSLTLEATPAPAVTLPKAQVVLSPADHAQVQAILAEKADFVDSPAFYQSDAERAIFDQPAPIGRADTSWYHPLMDRLGPAADYTPQPTMLLSAAQEKVIFTQFNYARYRVAQLRQQILDGDTNPNVAREMLRWHRKAADLRERIAEFNLGLVLAMAKRMKITEADFGEIISEGNMALLRAVDKFDVGRGFKFSTYACRAMLKAFGRTASKLTRIRRLNAVKYDPKMEKSNWSETRHQEAEDASVEALRRIITTNTANLSTIEQDVLNHRFGFNRAAHEPETNPLTLAQVGQLIGLTKERVRQIQQGAMDKIRKQLEDKFLT